MTYKLVRMCKEAVLPGRTEENHEKFQYKLSSIFYLTSESNSINHHTVTKVGLISIKFLYEFIYTSHIH
jgi:hypothetical protein